MHFTSFISVPQNPTVFLPKSVHRFRLGLLIGMFHHISFLISFTGNSTVYKNLSSCHRHMKVYLKDDVPDRLHYKNNGRIQPILLVADEGWTIVKNGKLPRRKCSFTFVFLKDLLFEIPVKFNFLMVFAKCILFLVLCSGRSWL